MEDCLGLHNNRTYVCVLDVTELMPTLNIVYAEEEWRLIWEGQQPLGQRVPQQHKTFKMLIWNRMVITPKTKLRCVLKNLITQGIQNLYQGHKILSRLLQSNRKRMKLSLIFNKFSEIKCKNIWD